MVYLKYPGTTRKKRTATCSASREASCTDPVVTNGDRGVAFTDCLVSEVHAISPNEGNGATSITITGTGFGSSADCVRVSVGGVYVSVQSPVTDTEIVANTDPADNIPVFVSHTVMVDITGKGLSRIFISDTAARVFTLYPSVSSITPNSGSLGGKTRVTITGNGFLDETGQNAVTVKFGIIPCSLDSYTYTEIICTTVASNMEATHDVIVMVKHQQATGSLDFSYTQLATPQLVSVDPDTVSGPADITLTGLRFTTVPTDASVNVGGTSCQVATSSDLQITCHVENLPVGSNPIEVHIAGKGKASQTGLVTLTQNAILTSIDPSEGSTGGGMTVEIIGMGFVPDDTSVLIGGAVCTIQQPVTQTSIICETGAHTAGPVSVTVTSNGVQYNPETLTYAYSNDMTPEVDTISPVEGVYGDTLTIIGSGFSSTTTDNRVFIGDTACVVTFANETVIQCTAGAGSNGLFTVDVYILGKGKPETAPQFRYRLQLTSLDPASGLKNTHLLFF